MSTVRSKIKLVCFDVDGTLVGRDLRISERVVSAIRAMRNRGIEGCLVTGRMYQATIGFARELRLTGPMVCYQGAAIVDPVEDRVLRDLPLVNSTVREIIDYAQRERMHLQLYRNDSYYCEERNRFSELYARLSGVEPVIVPSLREAFAQSPATKAVIVRDPADAEASIGAVREALGARAYVTRSYPEFIEMINPEVNKGDALRYVARHLGIDASEVAAIGDSWNDAPLLDAAGLAIAMGSAPPELRDVADHMVADVEHDGVAEAIERYVLA